MTMTSESAGLEAIAGVARERESLVARLLPLVRRYGLSAGGPVTTSAAHFITSMILLQALAPADFGLFAFLLIVVPFCLSLSGSLVAAPFVSDLRRSGKVDAASLATHLKVNLVLSALAAAAVAAAVAVNGTDSITSLLFGLYGGVMVLRAFGRSYAYVLDRPARVLASDMSYGGSLVLGLAALLAFGALTMVHAAAMLLGAALLGFAGLGRPHLMRQLLPGSAGRLRSYAGSWRELARWAMLGVILTEFTANAHAYVVTFIAGPKAFALLALGALVMRPASLVLSALPDIERPRMAKKIGMNDITGAFRTMTEFRYAAIAVWLGTLALAAAILFWFPELLLKKGYDETQVLMVVVLWGVILAVRTLRTPESVLLQAAGEFRTLAGVSLWSSLTAMTLTFGLLLAFGPVAALGGILAGDLVMTVRIHVLVARWKARHD
ncbi:MAG: hypothetical protein KGL26_05890 [Pseudomonadota bacterium]|nr:hypothetical protein [Pseudomonadota bacterium]